MTGKSNQLYVITDNRDVIKKNKNIKKGLSKAEWESDRNGGQNQERSNYYQTPFWEGNSIGNVVSFVWLFLTWLLFSP